MEYWLDQVDHCLLLSLSYPDNRRYHHPGQRCLQYRRHHYQKTLLGCQGTGLQYCLPHHHLCQDLYYRQYHRHQSRDSHQGLLGSGLSYLALHRYHHPDQYHQGCRLHQSRLPVSDYQDLVVMGQSHLLDRHYQYPDH